MVFLFIFN